MEQQQIPDSKLSTELIQKLYENSIEKTYMASSTVMITGTQSGKKIITFLVTVIAFFLLLHRQVISVKEREIGTKNMRISLHDTNLTLLNYRYLVARNLVFLF
jgi:hypothetical protein